MINPTPPFPTIPGDSEERIMARSGAIVGWNRDRVLWRFGFLPGSEFAQAYGVSTEKFIWILADPDGRTLDTFTGYAYELPEQFVR